MAPPLPKLRIKLQQIVKTQESEGPHKTLKPLHWRQKIKAKNPEKYEEIKARDALYSRLRTASLDDEKKQRRRELARERVRRCRLRKKQREEAERATSNGKSKKRRNVDKKKQTEQRQQWREKKRKARANWSMEKKLEINQKQKERRKHKRLELLGEIAEDKREKGGGKKNKKRMERQDGERKKQLVETEQEVKRKERAKGSLEKILEVLNLKRKERRRHKKKKLQRKRAEEERKKHGEKKIKLLERQDGGRKKRLAEAEQGVKRQGSRLEVEQSTFNATIHGSTPKNMSEADRTRTLSRVRKKIPSDPHTFADTIFDLIKQATPTQKRALQEKALRFSKADFDSLVKEKE